jgi:hypothetical protein
VRPLRHSSSAIVASQFPVTGLQPLAVQNALNPLDLVKLTPLMQIASGRAETRVAFIDGPVAINRPELSNAKIIELPGNETAITRHIECVRNKSDDWYPKSSKQLPPLCSLISC